MLKTTPFHERTGALCVSHGWRRWAGYLVASSYELSHEREYHAIRSSAALFDVSPLYKYLVRGKDAARLLDLVVTRSIQELKVGQVAYTPWCDAAGKVLDDGTVARLDETTFRMTAAEPNLRWLQDNAAGLDVTIKDVSDSIAALSLQGPASRTILGDLELKYFRLARAEIGDIGSNGSAHSHGWSHTKPSAGAECCFAQPERRSIVERALRPQTEIVEPTHVAHSAEGGNL